MITELRFEDEYGLDAVAGVLFFEGLDKAFE